VRTDFQKAVKDAEALTAHDQNLRTAERARERKSLFTEDEAVSAKAQHADYAKRIATPIKGFQRQAKRAGMTAEAIKKTVDDFRLLARKAKKANETLPVAAEHLRITK
jgi:hypothetical protein